MSSIEKAVERLKKEKKTDGVTGESVVVPEKTPQKTDKTTSGNDFVCHIDFKKLEQQGYLTPDTGRTNCAEEYRMVKRPILMNAFGKGAVPIEHGNLVMVTSALPGEGKTFTSLNLAMSMAMELDTTVLLIDSDVVRPSLTEMLGLSDEKGLIDVLLDPECDLSDVIVSTDMPNIKIMPAGHRHDRSTELLASEQMRQLTKELSQRYPDRMVIFDAPPILATSEASVLAPLLGQILMVVEAARTPQNAVKTALSRLHEDQVIGIVLNKSRHTMGSDYYKGYYYSSSE